MARRPSLTPFLILSAALMACADDGDLQGSRRSAQAGPPVEVIFNTPECDGCEDPSNGARGRIAAAIAGATDSIDFAIYGLDDPTVLDSLCAARAAGRLVRVVGDDESMERCIPQEQAVAFRASKREAYTREFVLWEIHRGFKVKSTALKVDGARRRRTRVTVTWSDGAGAHRLQSTPLATAEVVVSGLQLTGDTVFTVTVEHADEEEVDFDAAFSFLPDVFCSSQSYYPSFRRLMDCGVQVEFVVSQGIMHNKFYLIDAATDHPLIITGSMNQTLFCISKNHNHLLVLRDPPRGLIASYQAEFEQYIEHCRNNGRADCTECSPGCMLDKSEHGPWPLVGEGGEAMGEVSLYFSPTTKARSIDSLELLRGRMSEKDNLTWEGDDPKKVVPAHCKDPEGNCTCQIKKSSAAGEAATFKCYFCAGSTFDNPATDEQGWGLMTAARERLLITVYAATDPCFALGFGKVAQGIDLASGEPTDRRPEVTSIWNLVEAASPYTRDDQVCTAGVPVYVSNWGPIDPACGQRTGLAWREGCLGSSTIRNHNKLVILDDVVFDGSMNISASGNESNNENVLVLRSRSLADRFAAYVRAEVQLLESRGVRPALPAACACKDLIDNDGDGLVDQFDVTAGEPGCGLCYDEQDNDGDGLIDKDDPDCDLGDDARPVGG